MSKQSERERLEYELAELEDTATQLASADEYDEGADRYALIVDRRIAETRKKLEALNA